MFYLLFFNIIFCAQPIEIKKEFTNNALQILTSEYDWGTDVLSFNVFIKNYNKTRYSEEDYHFSFFSFLYLKNKIENLSKKVGFQYQARMNYQFSSFSISILKESFNINYKNIIDTFLNIEIEDLVYNKTKLDFVDYYTFKSKESDAYDVKNIIYNPKSLFLKFYDYSFRDFEKISLEKFRVFFAGFRSPNNVLITMSNMKNTYDLKKYIGKYKNKFNNNLAKQVSYDVVSLFTKRVVKFISPSSKTTLKIAFDGSRCGVKENMYFELLHELVKQGSFKAHLVEPANVCYSKFGFFEVSFFDLKDTVDETIKGFRDYLTLNLEKMDKKNLDILKRSLISRYTSLYLDKDKFMFLLGKSYVLENTIKYFLTFEQRTQVIEVDDFKSFINSIINKNYYELVIRG